MKKAIGVVAGLVVAAGVAWTAGAWYTGKRLETVMQQRVDEGNARLQAMFPGNHAVLSIDKMERHLFSSDMVLRVRVQTGGGAQGQPARQDVIDIAAHVGHGPFPLERLKHGELMPVMAAGTFGLQENDTARPWFQAAGNVTPVSGRVVIGYTQAASGNVRIEPVKLARDDISIDFSGFVMDFDQDAGKRTRLDGAMDSLVFKTTHGGAPEQAEITGLTVASDTHPGAADLYLGNTTLSVKKASLGAAGRPPVVLNAYTQRTESSEENGALALHAAYNINMLNVGGKDIGSVQAALGAKNLAPDAVKTLVTLYGRLWSRNMERAQKQGAEGAGKAPFAEPDLTPQEQAQALAARDALLAGNPTLYIDPILLKTPHGEARFTLNVDLGAPGSADQPIDARIAQAVRKLDARASLAKQLLADLLANNFQREGADASQANMQAAALAEMMGKMAADSGYAKMQGSDIVSSLQYADQVVDLNGRKMPLDQFAGMVLQSVMGLMMQTAPDMDEPGEDDPDLDEPDGQDQDQDQGQGQDRAQPPAATQR
jgi:uncharacterized protein YdgA (DUF945 family)